MTFAPSEDSDQPEHLSSDEFLLCTLQVAKDMLTVNSDQTGSDQTGWLSRLI